MDSLASLALATEPPKEDLLDRPPHSRDDYIISRKMVKHILIMSIYQSAVVFVIVFSGEYWIPEDKNYSPRDGDYIFPGRLYDWEGDDLYKKLRDSDDDPGPSRHFTIVFNTFVLMQIFNMLNARKINDEFNIFSGIFKNTMFVVIWIIILVMQILITQFTQDVFVVARKGLYWSQWLLCIAFGVSVIPLDALIKFVPDTVCPEIGKKKKKDQPKGSKNKVFHDSRQVDDKAATGFDKNNVQDGELPPNADKSSGEDQEDRGLNKIEAYDA
jgi:Ca2+ transporting ATPase